MPGIGMSIFLFAVGAVLAFAVHAQAQGFDVNTVGMILMIVGGVGFLASMMFWAPWAPYRRDREQTIVHDHGTDHTHLR